MSRSKWLALVQLWRIVSRFRAVILCSSEDQDRCVDPRKRLRCCRSLKSVTQCRPCKSRFHPPAPPPVVTARIGRPISGLFTDGQRVSEGIC